MSGAALASRLVLAAVFVTAAVTKLLDREGSRQALRDFGVRERLVGPVGVVLPLLELGVAVALVPAAVAWWGALGALVLLALFSAAIVRSLARGEAPDCHCFGQLHSTPVGWAALARNGLLGAAAVVVLAGGPGSSGASATAWIGRLSSSELMGLAALVVVVVIGLAGIWFALELLRGHGALLGRVDALEAALAGAGVALPAPAAPPAGLSVGSAAPDFELPDLDGVRVRLADLCAAGRPVLLVFSHPSCGPCDALLPRLVEWQHTLSDLLTIAVVGEGGAEENRAKVGARGLRTVLLQREREVAERFLAYGTPSAVMISAEGLIASALVSGPPTIEQLVRDALAMPLPVIAAGAGNGNGNGAGLDASARGGLPVGAQAPAFELPTIDGRTVSVDDLRGTRTAMLFWNPACGYCQQMLPKLKAWDSARRPDAPRLLVISRGDPAENRAMGLASPVALDESFAVGKLFGASGTPMAVLIDGDGRIASALGAGAGAALALLDAPSGAELAIGV